MIIIILLLICFNIVSIQFNIFSLKNQFVVRVNMFSLGHDLIAYNILFSTLFIKNISHPVKLKILICLP
ncbi:hypothetical protein HOF65_01235 [bacterium]|nr:hypothetical protein [bacterium]MBT4633753.1 hypothetical protein [bacterium]MBT6779277.1 hypothetical protein [bacterium]